MNKTNAYDNVALGQYLSDYPDDKTYEEVLDLILAEDESISIWEPFENYDPEWIVENIESLKQTLEEML